MTTRTTSCSHDLELVKCKKIGSRLEKNNLILQAIFKLLSRQRTTSHISDPIIEAIIGYLKLLLKELDGALGK